MSSCLGCREVSLLKVNKTFVCLNQPICSANHLVPCGFKNVVLFFHHILSFFQSRPQGNICLTHRTEGGGERKKNYAQLELQHFPVIVLAAFQYIHIYIFFKKSSFSLIQTFRKTPVPHFTSFNSGVAASQYISWRSERKGVSAPPPPLQSQLLDISPAKHYDSFYYVLRCCVPPPGRFPVI